MKKDIRKAIIAGNWKMNNNRDQSKILVNELLTKIKDTDCEVITCVPYTNLETVIELTKGTSIKVGAQNCHWAESGAFTAEISANMLKEMGVEYVIIGHSERRQYFGETDETVQKRVKAGLAAGLKVILCVGELLEHRELGVTSEIVGLQTKIALNGVTDSEMANVVIAYEPVWAIGTGKTATSDEADEVCEYIRFIIERLYDKDIAKKMSILYGGSMNPSNVDELLGKLNVDGGLIGGASLKSSDFEALVNSASK